MPPIKVPSHYDAWIAYLEKQKEKLNYLSVNRVKVRPDGGTERYTIGYLEKQKEPKEYHPLEDYSRGYNAGYYHGITDSEQKPSEKQDYSGLTDFERAIHRGFLCAGVVNVPVTIIKDTAQECMAKINPIWSEEDEKDMAHIIRILDDCYAYGKHDLSKTDHENLVNKLKSLRPQPKAEWSEEDEKRYLSCLCRLGTGNPDQPETQNSKWFREHVSPHPHWKPSEEQIQAIIYLASSIPPNFLKEQEYTMRLVDEVISNLKKL